MHIYHNEIAEILIEIEHIILEQIDSCNDYSLLTGIPGVILFFHERESNTDKKNELIELLFEKMSQTTNDLTHGSGLAGTSWLIEYIQQKNPEYDSNLLSEVDDVITRKIIEKRSSKEIELLSGISGLSIYLSRRHKKNDQTKNLEKYLDEISSIATIQNNLAFWNQPKNSFYRFCNEKIIEVNMGFAHGMPGIISSIFPIAESDILKKKSEKIIEQSIDWLVEHAKNKINKQSGFSYTDTELKKTRPGWCYGDLTNAVVINKAGIILNKEEYINFSNLLIKNIIESPEKYYEIEDLTLCHGASSMILLYQILKKMNKEYHNSKHEIKYVKFILDRVKKSGLKDEFKINSDKDKIELGILNGVTGLGLTLNSLLTENIEWSESIMACSYEQK